jgi:hypothetical protein
MQHGIFFDDDVDTENDYSGIKGGAPPEKLLFCVEWIKFRVVPALTVSVVVAIVVERSERRLESR